MRWLRPIVLVPVLLLSIGCATPPSPSMVQLGARFTAYKTLKLTEASRETAEKTKDIAGRVSVKIETDGTVNEAELDAELDRLIAEKFPNEEEREAISTVRDLAKQAVKDAIDKHGLTDRAKLVLVYVKATADGVSEGAVQYIEYLDQQEKGVQPVRPAIRNVRGEIRCCKDGNQEVED